MSRSMTAGMQAAIAAETGAIAHLLEVNASGGKLYLCTAPHDISWDGHTWVGIGGVLGIGDIEEKDDGSSTGTTLTLSGVDQTLIATILTNHVRGREAVIYLVHFDSSWAIVSDPLELFRGFLNGKFDVREHRDTEGNRAGTVTINTRIASRLDELGQVRAVRTNLHSHRDMLRRAGLASSYLADAFFQFVPELVNRPIYWANRAAAGYQPTDHGVDTGRTGHRR